MTEHQVRFLKGQIQNFSLACSSYCRLHPTSLSSSQSRQVATDMSLKTMNLREDHVVLINERCVNLLSMKKSHCGSLTGLNLSHKQCTKHIFYGIMTKSS